MVTVTEIEELKREIADLREKKQEIQETYELRNQIEEINVCKNRSGVYGDLTLLSDYKTKWWNSFYVRHRLYAEKKALYTLDEKKLERYKDTALTNPFHDNPTTSYSYISCICYYESYICSGDQIRLVLMDPYGSLITAPTTLITREEAHMYIQRMLYVEIGLLKNSDKCPLRKLTPLPYKLYMDL